VVATQISPIDVEIIRNAFISAADDMNGVLIRSAFTPVIYEMKDCAVALLDEEHRILGQSAGLPIFLGNLEACSRVTEEMFGREVWKPGDVWMVNDSYLTGTHLNDLTVYGPIFFGDELMGFASSRAHWLDIGSKDPGLTMNSTEIYQEGLRLGPTKIVDGGVLRADLVDLLARNSRVPDSTIGDLHAQIAVVRTGERRLSAVLEKFGVGAFYAARNEIYAQSERLDRAAVAEIPDGIYRAEGCLDNDGVGEEPYWVRVQVEVAGEEMTIDLTESSDAAKGPVNCGMAQAVAACRVAFKILVNPHLPVTGGSFRSLDVKVRPGSMLAAQEPSPCAWYFSCLGLTMDLVAKALAPVAPHLVAGANYGDSSPIIFFGVDPTSGRRFIDIQAHVGGWGGWKGGDGESGLINHVNGGLKDIPIEVVETKYPMRVARYGFREDSGGAGKWSGGCGIIREYVMEADEVGFSVWFERSLSPGWGVLGGEDAVPPRITINPGTSEERTLLKANAVSLARGDRVVCETGGGGGFGPKEERPREAIEAEVADGILSREGARAKYGLET
jgi:N-methylhydantoinase B